MRIELLIKILKYKIKQAESTAEEYIQELGNQEGADEQFAMIKAYQDIIDVLNSDEGDFDFLNDDEDEEN